MTARHSWMRTAADLGLNPDAGVRHDTFIELDALCVEAGVVGDTYATGLPGYRARDAYATIDGVLHTAPAMHNATTGGWPAPGDRRRFTSGYDREADHAAARAEDARQRNNDRLVDEADRRMGWRP